MSSNFGWLVTAMYHYIAILDQIHTGMLLDIVSYLHCNIKAKPYDLFVDIILAWIFNTSLNYKCIGKDDNLNIH